MIDRECSPANKDDKELSTDNDDLNCQEPVVAEHALENIEAIIQSTTGVLIEYLHPYEGVEDSGLESFLFMLGLIGQDPGTREVQNQCHS